MIQFTILTLAFIQPFIKPSLCYGDLDQEIVGDIFGSPKGISSDLCIPAGGLEVCSGNGDCLFGSCKCAEGWSGQFCSICQNCRAASTEMCEKVRGCVEGVVFDQYWKHFKSAYECTTKCSGYNFINPTADVDCVCPANYDPVCGLDGKTYGNSCEAQCQGVAEECEGKCPCPNSGSVCEFHKNLEGDSICPPYKYKVQPRADSVIDILVYRPPCLADDLDVNVGVWKGETGIKVEEDVEYTYPNGWGVLTYQPEDVLNREEFKGEMKYGVREGHGTLYWKDGSYYAGEWKGDAKEGEGTMFYSNGDIYTGQWTLEKKHGEGKYMYSKGGEYTGVFNSGRKSGSGRNYVMIPETDWEYFTGDYVDGSRKTGVFNTSLGYTYSGDFSTASGSYNGTGSYIWACGRKYQGNFVSGLPSGQGVLTFPQGWVYTGAFCSGKFQGYGKFTWSENHYYQGEFLDGKMTGVGVYAFADGGLYDNASGLYYPDRNNKSVFKEGHFDGNVLRVKKSTNQAQRKPLYGN